MEYAEFTKPNYPQTPNLNSSSVWDAFTLAFTCLASRKFSLLPSSFPSTRVRWNFTSESLMVHCIRPIKMTCKELVIIHNLFTNTQRWPNTYLKNLIKQTVAKIRRPHTHLNLKMNCQRPRQSKRSKPMTLLKILTLLYSKNTPSQWALTWLCFQKCRSFLGKIRWNLYRKGSLS